MVNVSTKTSKNIVFMKTKQKPLPTLTYLYTLYSSANCMAHVSRRRYPCRLDVYSCFECG